ncbi:MAG: NADH:quinone oxidoreductase [Paracoccus sp. (in: a-proteobacteria)]
MQQNECTRNCWIAAGVVGLLVWIFASFIGSTAIIGGLFLALIATVLVGLFLLWALCQGSGSAADDRHHGFARATAAPEPAASPTAMPLQSPAPAPRAAAAPAAAAAVTAAAPAPAAASEAPKPAPAKPEAKPAVAKTAEAKAATKPAVKKGSKPAAKAGKAAKAKPDDLKQIKGVGPKLEKLLHENGVTGFAQIAAWSEAQIDEFAEKIGSMGGRIRSDDWIAQARTLAGGGSTEFAQRVKKGDVY